MNLAHWIERNALERPDGPAVGRGADVVFAHGELRDRVERLAAGLQSLGLNRGDRVALAMKNVPEYFEVLFAIWHAGLAAVPMNAKLHASEFTYILENSGCKACFVTPALRRDHRRYRSRRCRPHHRCHIRNLCGSVEQ